MPPEGWQHVRRLLVMRLDNVGDAVMIGPALRALRAELPDASITLLASPAGAQVAPMLPWVDDVWCESVVWQDASGRMSFDPAREYQLVERIRSGAFDAAIIFTSFSQSPYPAAYLCYLAGIPIRLGQSKAFGGSVLSQCVKPLPNRTHQVDRNRHLIESAGFLIAGRHLELTIPLEAREAAASLLAARGVDANAPFVALAPGASCAARRYDPDRYAAAMRIVAAETRVPIVIVGGAKERELAQYIAAGIAPEQVTLLAGETSIPELAGVIERSAIVVANDSGPMHIADALLRPMVILFSGTELESQWEPRSAPAALVRRPTACSPCYAFNCPYAMECLDIPPSEVADAVMSMLALPSSREGVIEGEFAMRAGATCGG